MATINQVKQLAEADTPLLFFECALPSGDIEHWSTHAIALNGQNYSARILKHNLFDLQLSADDAMDGLSQIALTLANADSALSELNAAIGFKGSKLTVYFAFADLPSSTITTESTVLFRGVAGDPDRITEDSLTLHFSNKLSLQRMPVPDVRIQRSCPWNFPATAAQRSEARDGGAQGVFSRFYRCGYSADQPGGMGNLNAGQPFTTCDKTRVQCQTRGMFDKDVLGSITRRFGGFDFVPSAINVRTAGDKTSHLSPLLDNSAKYNDPAPLVYGTGWLQSPVILARNDGNLTHLETLLGVGVMQGIFKVVVNDVEIPAVVSGQDMTATGWFLPVTNGTREGGFNLDFTDTAGNPLGDPYGSLSVLSIVVPNRISSGRSVPKVEVLLQGLKIDTYNGDSSFKAHTFTNNPAWVTLDILRRCGWSLTDVNLASFAASAAFCQQLISTTDLNGNAASVQRYACNLVITKRQSAASLVRGIRIAASLMLRYGATGLLELLPETSIAAQQPALPDGGNSKTAVQGGWPSYEFSDSSDAYSGIVRNPDSSSTLSLSSRSIAETSNRLSIEFQDESNEYQQDSLSVVDSDDSALIGYEVSSQSLALGIANFSQATRVLLRQLDKSTKGNLFIQFQTSFRALKVRPGDIIAVTYLKEGFERALFRVTKLSPSMNYQLVTVIAQIHDDAWYSDNPATIMNSGRQPGSIIQVPRPLIGKVAHNDANGNFEYFDFDVAEQIQAQRDGSATDTLTVSFSAPAVPSANFRSLPLLSFSWNSLTTGGTLKGGSSLYYAFSAIAAGGIEGPLSFTVPVSLPAVSDTNQVIIKGLSFPAAATQFNAYRGSTPQELYLIDQNLALADTYTDSGAPAMPVGPPDASYDHANFYYRSEFAGPFQADIFSPSTIGSEDMGATSLAYSGMMVRVIEGKGRGQERQIASNDRTTLTVSSTWSVVPDSSSLFVIAEGSWKFAAVTATSPAKFELPYQSGTAIQISGRAANVHNQEASADLCPITRRILGGGQSDLGVAQAPSFTVAAPGAGVVSISGVVFPDLDNTSSVTSGTLQLFSWNELLDTNAYSLAADLDAVETTVQIAASGASSAILSVGDVIQIGTELLILLAGASAPNAYLADRGAFATTSAAHTAGDAVLLLDKKTTVIPFAPGFFENRASQNFIHTLSLPDHRIAAADFYVTNSFGDSQTNQVSYLSLTESGLRTLSGGQFSFQVSGYVTTQQSAAPPILVGAAHAVRDIRATITQPSLGYIINMDIVQNDSVYCSLEIDAGQVVSTNVVDGETLPPLIEGATLTMNVSVSSVQDFDGAASPGRDLTVTIRL